jgi:hypothetical protein
MRVIVWWLTLALATVSTELDQAWRCLDHGDARSAAEALEAAPPPAANDADRASWLDARARIAWARGEMDRAFALGIESVVVGERTGRQAPAMTPAIAPGRPWIDEATGLPRLLLPTGDGDGPALARELLALPESGTPEGAWILWAARLLDEKVPAPEAARANRATGSRRQSLLQAAAEARRGSNRSRNAVIAALRGVAREGSGLEPFVRWFEAEAVAREGPGPEVRLAALRMVQAAAAADDNAWLRVRALERAATLLDPVDAPEAARLREAARKETP